MNPANRPSKSKVSPLFSSVTTIAAIAAFACSASAADCHWTGAAGDRLWSSAGNWEDSTFNLLRGRKRFHSRSGSSGRRRPALFRTRQKHVEEHQHRSPISNLSQRLGAPFAHGSAWALDPLRFRTAPDSIHALHLEPGECTMLENFKFPAASPWPASKFPPQSQISSFKFQVSKSP
jgi:hypothetical protein